MYREVEWSLGMALDLRAGQHEAKYESESEYKLIVGSNATVRMKKATLPTMNCNHHCHDEDDGVVVIIILKDNAKAFLATPITTRGFCCLDHKQVTKRRERKSQGQ
jgi:hypothetical protein